MGSSIGSISFGIVAVLTTILVGCGTYEENELKRARSDIESKSFESALNHINRILKTADSKPVAVEAAKEGAKVTTELGDHKRAIPYYKHLVLYAKDPELRKQSQLQIAQIYFENLNDYQNAIVEYNRLLEMPHSAQEEVGYRFRIAKSYFYKNNFFQAESEVDEVLKKPNMKSDTMFDLLMLKGNIYMTQKDLGKSLKVYEEILQKYPERAEKENIRVNIAVCYEEQKDYAKAIDSLEKAKANYPTPEYLELRIKRLKDREKQLPGARGLHK